MEELLSLALKSQRKRLGLSQLELAQRCGVGLATIQNIESNKANPELKTVLKLLDSLQLKLEIVGVPSHWEDLVDYGVPLLGTLKNKSIVPDRSSLVHQLQNLKVSELKKIKEDRAITALASFFSAIFDHYPSVYHLMPTELQVFLKMNFLNRATPKLRRIALSQISSYL